MWCAKCQKPLHLCTCDDIDERLASLNKTPNLILTFCDKCGKYIDRCECDIAKDQPQDEGV